METVHRGLMSILAKGKTKIWVEVHLIMPLVPFLLEGIIRFVLLGYRMNLETFNIATLAISFTFICRFTQQSLINNEHLLANDEVLENIKVIAQRLYYFGFGSSVSFMLIIALKALADRGDSFAVGPLTIFRCITVAYVFAVLVPQIIQVQRSYKLGVKI